ncbi:MAG TPA: hypothetical protein EYP10_02200, partial [Armatimonadetes bacterium]|nr:hypothetical protein [Armatimonadota bacterium]
MEIPRGVIEMTAMGRGIGMPVMRIDAPAMVTGEAKYGTDIIIPGMLHGRILRSSFAHARIVHLDVSDALRMPGVHAVVTAADTPDTQLFAKDYVSFVGQKIAAVAADSPDLAEEAVHRIHIEYEPLPAVVDVRDAIRPDAPIACEGASLEEVADVDGTPLSNIARFQEFIAGDVDEGFREADVIVEGEFYVPSVHQGHLEINTSVAQVEASSGRVVLWSSTQGHFQVRAITARLLG